jgi:hypothetical protein
MPQNTRAARNPRSGLLWRLSVVPRLFKCMRRGRDASSYRRPAYGFVRLRNCQFLTATDATLAHPGQLAVESVFVRGITNPFTTTTRMSYKLPLLVGAGVPVWAGAIILAEPITIDIKTRFIGDENRVYIVFPGEGYRYYETFRDESVVFLDIPGFPVPTKKFSEAEDLLQRLVISERVRAWHAKSDPNQMPPERDPNKVTGYKATKSRLQTAGRVQNFFAAIRKGDIVVVPPGSFDDDVLYGEIADETDSYILVPAPRRHPNEQIPGRRVIWRGVQPRHTVAGWLERKLPNQNPVGSWKLAFINMCMTICTNDISIEINSFANLE